MDIPKDKGDLLDAAGQEVLNSVLGDWFVGDWYELFRPGMGERAESGARSSVKHDSFHKLPQRNDFYGLCPAASNHKGLQEMCTGRRSPGLGWRWCVFFFKFFFLTCLSYSPARNYKICNSRNGIGGWWRF